MYVDDNHRAPKRQALTDVCVAETDTSTGLENDGGDSESVSSLVSESSAKLVQNWSEIILEPLSSSTSVKRLSDIYKTSYTNLAIRRFRHPQLIARSYDLTSLDYGLSKQRTSSGHSPNQKPWSLSVHLSGTKQPAQWHLPVLE